MAAILRKGNKKRKKNRESSLRCGGNKAWATIRGLPLGSRIYRTLAHQGRPSGAAYRHDDLRGLRQIVLTFEASSGCIGGQPNYSLTVSPPKFPLYLLSPKNSLIFALLPLHPCKAAWLSHFNFDPWGNHWFPLSHQK